LRLGKENERVWRKTGDKAEDYARGDENSLSCEPTSRLAGWSAGKRGQSPPPPTFYYPTGGGNQKMCDCGGVVFAPVSLLARSTHLVYGEPETDEHEQAAQRPHLALHPPHLLHRASLKRGGSITTFWFLFFFSTPSRSSLEWAPPSALCQIAQSDTHFFSRQPHTRGARRSAHSSTRRLRGVAVRSRALRAGGARVCARQNTFFVGNRECFEGCCRRVFVAVVPAVVASRRRRRCFAGASRRRCCSAAYRCRDPSPPPGRRCLIKGPLSTPTTTTTTAQVHPPPPEEEEGEGRRRCRCSRYRASPWCSSRRARRATSPPADTVGGCYKLNPVATSLLLVSQLAFRFNL
jgi:hypothetical protein